MDNGKDPFEKELDKILSRNSVKPSNNQGIGSLHSIISILTVHQVAEVIVNLAIPISSFTSKPERYCEIWHKEIGNDIKGIRSMLEILEKAYGKVDATFQRAQKT
jgi:hypothetical protein